MAFLVNVNSKKIKFLKVIIDQENFYTIIYLALSIWAIINPFVYPFLLLDVVKNSDDLQNVIKSVTQNFRTLYKTVILGLIVLFLFATVGFAFFSSFYYEVILFS